MAGTTLKKRSRDDAPKIKPPRPTKKQRKQALDAYHSDSASDADANADEFPAVNLLDSDSDDIHNARADTGGASNDDSDDSASDASSISSNTRPNPRKSKNHPSIARNAPPSKLAHDAPRSSSDQEDDDDDNDEYSDLSASDDDDGATTTMTGANAQRVRGSRAKRNDPTAFATSLTKILSTKLSTARRADPVLARSAAAHEASRLAVDSALESKARKQLRTAKRAAMEKGRVRDVLVATNGVFGGNVNPVTGQVVDEAAQAAAGESVGAVVETERRLRKVAQRGVVQLFNAFRVAQVKAAEAQRGVVKERVIGVDRKKEKVAEMSKKGFLDLIASGGGGLKKGPIEEA